MQRHCCSHIAPLASALHSFQSPVSHPIIQHFKIIIFNLNFICKIFPPFSFSQNPKFVYIFSTLVQKFLNFSNIIINPFCYDLHVDLTILCIRKCIINARFWFKLLVRLLLARLRPGEGRLSWCFRVKLEIAATGL